MNKNWTKIGLGVYAVAALAGSAAAQKPTNAERGLIGVNLYDSGLKVVALYGSPDEIQAVSVGGGNTGGGAPGFGGPGFGGPGGAPGGRGGPSRGGGGPASTTGSSSADRLNPFGFGDDFFRQQERSPAAGPKPTAGGPSGSGGPGPGGYPGGAPGGYPGRGGPTGGSPYGGSPSSGGGAASGPLEATQYTRWIYNRAGSKYGFIVDNQNRVVQIEAIGMQNNRVKTRKGVGFGATFAQIVKTYGTPDGYEVGGDTILIKYLVNKKVAFRLTRLAAKKPHVVTGVVVAAGKV